MDTSPKKISKNFISISVSQALSLFLNLIAFGLIARYLTVENFGNFSLLLAIVGILSKIIDLGISPIVFRESSNNVQDPNFLLTALSIRFFVFLIVQIIANIFLFIYNYSYNQIVLFNILMISIIISSKMANFRDLLAIPFKVNLNMFVPSFLTVIDSLVFLSLIIIMPLVKGGLLFLTLAYVFSNFPSFIVLLIILKKNYGFHFTITLNRAKWLLKESVPLAGFVILMSIFQQVDLLLLKELSNSYATGIYSSAIRLVLPLNLIPNALVTTVFPILIRKEIEREVLTESVYKILFFISITFTIVFAFKAEEFINIVFGQKYVAAELTSIILFGSQIFMFLNFFSLSVFTADGKQKRNFYYAVILVVVNIMIDILLIPKYLYMGAAVAKLVSAFLGFLYTLYLLRKNKVQFKYFKIRHFMWIVVFSLSVYLLSDLNLFLYLLGTFVVLIISTLITKFFSKKEINYFTQIIK